MHERSSSKCLKRMGNDVSGATEKRRPVYSCTNIEVSSSTSQNYNRHRKKTVSAQKLLQYLQEGKIEKFTKTLMCFELETRKETVISKVNTTSCLLLACCRDYVEAMKFMVEHCGIDPNMEVDRHNVTLLHIACIKQSIRVAQYLLEVGADVLKLTDNGKSCLKLCSKNETLCKILVQNGANINDWTDDRGRPIIFSACEERRVNLLKFLLDHGADANMIGNENLTPAEIAARAHYNTSQSTASNETIQCLLKNGNLDDRYKIRVYDIIGCKLVRFYLIRSNDQELRFSNILKAKKYWKNGRKIQLKMEGLKNHDTTVTSDTDTDHVTNCDYDDVFQDFIKIFDVAVSKMQTIFGLNNVETISLIKHIAKWHVASNKEPRLCVKFFQNVVKSTTEEVNFATEAWLKEFMIFLVYLVRIPKRFDVQIYDLTMEATCWFIRKLKDALEIHQENSVSPKMEEKLKSSMEPNESQPATSFSPVTFTRNALEISPNPKTPLSAEIVATMFTILKRIVSWKFTEEREVCLKKIISSLVNANFSYESESFLDYAIEEYFCWQSCKLEARLAHCTYVLKSFLRYGMPADLRDQLDNSVLILLLERFVENDSATAKLIGDLLEYFHLDIKNRHGQSALQLLKQKGFSVCEVKHRTLQCLCAEVIRMQGILYRGVVPASLVSFIGLH